MEDTFLDGIFLGMGLRSDEILFGTARGVIKTRTLRRRVEEEQWDEKFRCHQTDVLPKYVQIR